jgi:Restriction endonuclease
MTLPNWLHSRLAWQLKEQHEGVYSVSLALDSLLAAATLGLSDDERLAHRISLEELEPFLLKGLVFEGWALRYSVYSGLLNCERLVHPDRLARIAEVHANSIREYIAQKANTLSPSGFEALATDVFASVPWSRNIERTGHAGDGGIDFRGEYQAPGFRDTVPLLGQVKKLTGPAGSPELRNFAGAIAPYSSRQPKGLFVSRDGFTASAVEYVREAPYNIALFSLTDLIELMLEEKIGIAQPSIEFVVLDHAFWEHFD